MENLEISNYEDKISKLNELERKLRDLYLRKLATGEIQGPTTGKMSIDKIWLKYYTENQIASDLPKMTIYEYMMRNNRSHMSDTALYYFGKKISFKEFDKLIDKCKSSLIKSGVKPGDIITICMPNTPEAVITFYAINKMGAIANMIHPLSGQNEIKRYINEVKSKMIITMDISYNKVLNIARNTYLEKIVVVEASDSMPIYLKAVYPFTKNKIDIIEDKKMVKWADFIQEGNALDKSSFSYEKNRTAVLLHTGGTTGVPKGVELTNDNFNDMVEQFILGTNDFERNDKMLTIMPVFHGFGLCSSIHLPLSVGVASVLIPKLDAEKFDRVLKKYHPNHIIGVPTLFKAMMKNEKLTKTDLSYLKYVVSGGDLVKDSLESDINDFLREHKSEAKLSKGYGLSEAVAGATFAYGNYNKPTSIGIPMVKTNIKIVDPGTNVELQNGEIGEICIQGPTVMKKYYHNEEETKETIKNGWLHTGDLGYYDGDVLYFAQRKGNMIISSGVNVYPSNIEQVIESHDAVAACAVIGIHHTYKMQVPKAYIILKDGYEASESLKEEIESLCRKHLNVYSIPYSYEFREKLPQTLLGKISHRSLEEEEKVKVYTKNK